jgi:hypothetical protein
MAQPTQYVDISRFPPDERPHIIDLAQKHNALSEDVDKVSGTTPEEKKEMHMAYEKFRKLVRCLHAKRFSISLLTLELGFIMFILDKLGLNTRNIIPDLIQLIQILKN